MGAYINVTTSLTSLSANWSGSFDQESGIAKYWYCIGTTPGDSNVVAWVDTMLSQSTTKNNLHLTQGQWYYFSVRAEDGAGLKSIKITSDGQRVDTTQLTTGINKLNIENLVCRVYPNPAQNTINIDYSLTQNTTIKWQVTDVIGQVVLQSEDFKTMGTYTQSLDIAMLSKGLYLLNITSNGQQKTIKFIKD